MLIIYNQANMNVVLEFKDKTHVHIDRYGQASVDPKYKDEVAACKSNGMNITFVLEETVAPKPRKNAEPVTGETSGGSDSRRKGGGK